MLLRNLSSYPTDEVRILVLFGMQGIDHSGDVRVTVEDRGMFRRLLGMRGCTGSNIDLDTNEWHGADVTIWLDTSPYDYSWNNIFHSDDPALDGKPYGGSWATYYQCHDWKEALVSIAAHESYHVQAGRSGHLSQGTFAPDGSLDTEGETAAEAHAVELLNKYRKTGVRSV